MKTEQQGNKSMTWNILKIQWFHLISVLLWSLFKNFIVILILPRLHFSQFKPKRLYNYLNNYVLTNKTKHMAGAALCQQTDYV